MTYKQAKNKDLADPLQSFSEKFVKKNENLIYLDGNSLGMLPKNTRERLFDVIDNEWGNDLIESWNKKWFHLSKTISKKLSYILGCQDSEVIVSDNTSTNLYKVASAALNLKHDKSKILTDELNFPSDIYIFQGLQKKSNDKITLEILPASPLTGVNPELLEERLKEGDVAFVSFSHLTFKNAFMYPMKAITELVHKYDALMIWDLSHSVGSVPVNLNQSDVDFAVGCTYKHVNGGPGSPAFLYVKKEWQEKVESPVWGWFGQKDPFQFSKHYQSATGIDRFMTGSPAILSLSALEPSLDILLDAGMDRVREKNIALTTFFGNLLKDKLAGLGFQMASPVNPEFRGSHISIRHSEAYRICQSLINPPRGRKKIIPDFREPDNIRFGIAALYNSFTDIYNTADRLMEIVSNKEYEKMPSQKPAVT